jgi:hypothetical protein
MLGAKNTAAHNKFSVLTNLMKGEKSQLPTVSLGADKLT